MPSSSAAETVLATIGTLCWTAQLLPQIFKTWRTKSIEGLSPYLVLIWGLSGFFLGVYAIVQRLNMVLIVQPHLTALFCLISWGQCLFYGNPNRSAWAAAGIFASLFIVMGAFEVGMIFAVTPSYNKGNTAAVQVLGYASAVLIGAGLLPQYYEIYTLRQVIGISLTFMTIDMLGGVFLDLSLAFSHKKFDVVASITYSVVVVMDGAVLIAAAILNPRKRRQLKRELEAGIVTGPSTINESESTTPKEPTEVVLMSMAQPDALASIPVSDPMTDR